MPGRAGVPVPHGLVDSHLPLTIDHCPVNQVTIAWVDMRPNLAVATVILIALACAVALLSRRKGEDGNKSRWWIPLASLVAGPVIAFGFWAADVFVLHPDMYPTPFQGDAMATLSRVMIVGTFVGVVVSVIFALGGVMSRGSTRKNED